MSLLLHLYIYFECFKYCYPSFAHVFQLRSSFQGTHLLQTCLLHCCCRKFQPNICRLKYTFISTNLFVAFNYSRKCYISLALYFIFFLIFFSYLDLVKLQALFAFGTTNLPCIYSPYFSYF